MDEEGFDNVPVTPNIPPMEPGPIAIPPRSSSWPMVIGVIAIVIGVLGQIGGIWGMVAVFFMDSMMSMVPASQRAEIVDSMKGTELLSVVCGILGIVLAVLLLVSGIGLTKRRPWSPKMCKVWAVLKMLLVVFTTVSGVMVQRSSFEAMSQQSNAPGFQQGMFIGMLIGTCFGLLWGWALPVFMLIWFSRSKIKEEVADWE